MELRRSRIVESVDDESDDACETETSGDDLDLMEPEESPLHSAARANSLRTLAEVYRVSDNINIKDKKGRTALMLAIKLRHQEVAIALIHYGANLDVVDNNGDSPLLYALKTEQYDLATFILNLQQNVNIANKEEKTAIHYAVEKGKQEIVLKLISLGANIDPVDWEGKTPLMISCSNGDFEMTSLLLNYKADLTKTDSQLYSARDYASSGGFSSIVNMLDNIIKKGLSTSPEQNDEMWLHSSSAIALTSLEREDNVCPAQIPLDTLDEITFSTDEFDLMQVPSSSFDNKSTSSSSSSEKITIICTNVQHGSTNVSYDFRSSETEGFDTETYEVDADGSMENSLLSQFQYEPSIIVTEGESINPTISSVTQDCRYEKKTLEWKQLYGPEIGGSGEVKLLQDQKLETEFMFTKGHMELCDKDSSISARDLLSNGLQMLLPSQHEQTYLPVPDITNIIKLTQLDSTQLAKIQEWFDQEHKMSEILEKDIEGLVYFMKNAIIENKNLKKSIAMLKEEASQLESRLGDRSSHMSFAEIRKEIKNTRKEMAMLDQEHRDTIQSKAQLLNAIEDQFEDSNRNECSVVFKLQNLKSENRKLCHLLETYETQAKELSSYLFKRLDESLKTVRILFNLLGMTSHLLQEQSQKTSGVELNSHDQSNILNKLLESIYATEERCKELMNDFESLEQASTIISDHAHKVETEIRNLLKNFESFRNSLTDHRELENDKKRTWFNMQNLLESIKREKKNIQQMGKNARKLEEFTKSSEAKEEKDVENISHLSREEQKENRETWNDKINKLLDFFEYMDEISAEIKNNTKLKAERLLEENWMEKDPFLREEGITKFTARFICSNAKMGEVSTKSGVCSVTEAAKPKVDTSFGLTEQQKAYKSSYSVGEQNISSMPETTKSKLQGTFAKYKLREAQISNSSPFTR